MRKVLIIVLISLMIIMSSCAGGNGTSLSEKLDTIGFFPGEDAICQWLLKTNYGIEYYRIYPFFTAKGSYIDEVMVQTPNNRWFYYKGGIATYNYDGQKMGRYVMTELTAEAVEGHKNVYFLDNETEDGEIDRISGLYIILDDNNRVRRTINGPLEVYGQGEVYRLSDWIYDDEGLLERKCVCDIPFYDYPDINETFDIDTREYDLRWETILSFDSEKRLEKAEYIHHGHNAISNDPIKETEDYSIYSYGDSGYISRVENYDVVKNRDQDQYEEYLDQTIEIETDDMGRVVSKYVEVYRMTGEINKAFTVEYEYGEDGEIEAERY